MLACIKNWAEFEALANAQSDKGKGDLFELLTKYYLLLHPTYRTELSDVWLFSEVPQKVRAELNLPARDQGIDIIARTKTGAYWVVQSKYRANAKHSLTWNEISTFIGLTFGVWKGFEFGLIAYTGERYTKVLDELSTSAFCQTMCGVH
jgi:predicted helicase